MILHLRLIRRSLWLTCIFFIFMFITSKSSCNEADGIRTWDPLTSEHNYTPSGGHDSSSLQYTSSHPTSTWRRLWPFRKVIKPKMYKSIFIKKEIKYYIHLAFPRTVKLSFEIPGTLKKAIMKSIRFVVSWIVLPLLITWAPKSQLRLRRQAAILVWLADERYNFRLPGHQLQNPSMQHYNGMWKLSRGEKKRWYFLLALITKRIPFHWRSTCCPFLKTFVEND